MEEDNDGDDEDDLLDENNQLQTPLFSTEHAQQGEEGTWACSTSTTSSQSEQTGLISKGECRQPSSQNSQKKKRAQKPTHMRRNIRKLLREDQLEAVTQAAQQEELERRKRLEQQRKEFPASIPIVPVDFIQEEIVLKTDEVSRAPSRGTSQEVICLDSSSSSRSSSSSSSSGSEDDTKGKSCSAKDEVIEVSSGEDETLQILDSSDSTHEEEDETTEESSGSHINDAMNQPDALGRVLVNINHPPNESDIFLASQLARAVKPHQIGGIRFLYDNLVESLERFKTSSGFGCILAHSMGLGKTLQVISFVDVLLKHTEARTVLAIVPVNTLQNWLAEFNMWLPPSEAFPVDYNPEEAQPRTFKVHILNDEHKTTAARAKVVADWSMEGGVLLLGYEMYRLLSLKKSFVAGRKKKSKKPAGPVIIDLDEEDRQQELLNGIGKALSKPGPDVVICDEGHRIKNCHASTSQALKNIRSRRRVVLTGYPLQNNLIEYWCMVDFVRPDFLGTRQEFSNMFERPILNGQCIDSTPQDVRFMRYRSHVLHSLLEGFVQRRGHDVLKAHLPTKEECVILVRLSPIQRALYTEFMNRFRDAGNNGWLGLNPLKAFCVCCKIWNHPDVLYEAVQKENLANEQDLDLDDLGTGTSNTRCQPQGGKCKAESNAPPAGGDATNSKFIQGIGLNPFQERANQVITYEWAKDILCDYRTGVLENSAKIVLLFHLIEESVKIGDKILVFSQSLSTLSVIEEFLAKRTMPRPPGVEEQKGVSWIRNLNYYRLDGSTSTSERERLINQFNDPSNTNVWLFLLSTRAQFGCAALRMLNEADMVVFQLKYSNPMPAAHHSYYQLGEGRVQYLFRGHEKFFKKKKNAKRQRRKNNPADRVVDDLNPALNFTRREVESLLHFVEEEPDPLQVKLEHKNLVDPVMRLACLKYPHLITKDPFCHESLLTNRKEHKLTKAEKKAAKKGYEDEKRASVPYTRPSYAQYYPASDINLANIPAFNQRKWRPPLKSEERPVASVRPVQSTPIPMTPRHIPAGFGTPGPNPGLNFPVNFLQRAGVYVQKIVTTTAIVIPGANTSTDVQARIGAGESLHVIRGNKGTYIRTSDGRIFAIRTASKPKTRAGTETAPSCSQGAATESTSNGAHSTSSPDPLRTKLSPEEIARPLSPDSPEIISELQQYAEAAAARESTDKPSSATGAQGDHKVDSMVAPTRVTEQLFGIHGLNSTQPSVSSLPTTSQSIFGNSALDLRGTKRKPASPSTEEQPRKQQNKRPPALPQGFEHGYPMPSGLNLPAVGLNHALSTSLLTQAGNPLYMGGASPYYQIPNLLGDPQLMFPVANDSLLGSGPPTSVAATSTPATVPPFMFNHAVAGMLPDFPFSYPQPVLPEARMFASYPNSVLAGSLPASTGPSNRGYLGAQTAYSAGFFRPQMPPSEPQLVSEPGGSSDDDDDDVIEVMGQ
uniref:RAD54 like 2 n=1 Tax=Latimeria chalumnae TaxID=7897 RepID=H3B8E5_LATCH